MTKETYTHGKREPYVRQKRRTRQKKNDVHDQKDQCTQRKRKIKKNYIHDQKCQ